RDLFVAPPRITPGSPSSGRLDLAKPACDLGLSQADSGARLFAMTSRGLAAIVTAALGAAGCGAPAFHAAWPDAQLELRDDGDREQAIDRLWLVPAGPDRDRARAPIAAALARRISDAAEDDQPFVAAALLDQLTGLWQGDPTAVGRGLAGHAAMLRELRAMFAKSGTLEPAV